MATSPGEPGLSSFIEAKDDGSESQEQRKHENSNYKQLLIHCCKYYPHND